MKWIIAISLCVVSTSAHALVENFVPNGWDFAYYTFTLTTVIFCALVIIAYREYKWLWYIGFSLLAILSGAGRSGMLVWVTNGGDFTLWVTPFLLFAAQTTYGYVMIAQRLESPHRFAALKPVLYTLAVLTALFPLTAPLWLEKISIVLMWMPVNVLFFTMMGLQVLPPFTWSTQDRTQRLLTRVFPFVVAFVLFTAYAGHWFFFNWPQEALNVLARFTSFVYWGFALALVIRQIFISTQDRERAEAKALQLSRIEAETRLALAQAEEEYQLVKSLADERNDQLANISHDLKQPLTALSAAMKRLETDVSADTVASVQEAMEYVANLAQSAKSTGAPATVPSATEQLSTKILAQTLFQMFKADADDQRVRLRVRYPNYVVEVAPLALVRILANLLTNTLTHASARNVLIGFRSRGEEIAVQVVDDGKGLDPAELEALQQRGVKGADSNGDGLGLSIVASLCRDHGYAYRVSSKPTQGSVFEISVPRWDNYSAAH